MSLPPYERANDYTVITSQKSADFHLVAGGYTAMKNDQTSDMQIVLLLAMCLKLNTLLGKVQIMASK